MAGLKLKSIGALKNKLLTSLVVMFAISFLSFVVVVTDNLSNSKKNLLNSQNIIDVTSNITTKLLVTDVSFHSDDEWTGIDYRDNEWRSIRIPSYQVVQEEKFAEGNYAYYRIRIPQSSFAQIKHLIKESSIALQFVFYSKFDVFINGHFYRTYKPKNSVEANVILPVNEDQDNVICIKGYISKGDTGIDHRDNILLGSGVELNSLHSLSYKVQTVFQLIFILCKGSILLIFALIYLLLKVQNSFEKFFVFGICAVLEELIAGEYFYGPLNFNQMVFLYNAVNFGGATAVFLFFSDSLKISLDKSMVKISFGILFVMSIFLTMDALSWNYLVNLTSFMKFWNLVFVAIMFFYIPAAFQKDHVLFFVLCVSSALYVWGALFAINIGLNFKAYGNLLLFILVAYETFVIFKREQDQLHFNERKLLEQEKDVAIGKTASFLAHDIRKPLEQLKLVIEKISSGDVGTGFIDIAKTDIDLSISSINQQVNDIINYSKSSKIDLVQVSFYKILNYAVKQVMSIHQEMDIALHYDLRAQNKILGDEARLSVAIVNLLSNAVEAIRDLGGQYKGVIKFSTAISEDAFIFRIFNDGPSIPGQHLEDIFKPLFTLGKSNGTGLGLASVVKTIHEHEALITAENKAEGGVEFILKFKVAPGKDDPRGYNFEIFSKRYSYKAELNDPNRDSVTLRVLALETCDLKLERIKHELKAITGNLELATCSCYVEASEHIRKKRFDIYILNTMKGGDEVYGNLLNYLHTEIILYSESLPGNLLELSRDAFSNRKRVLFVDDTKLFRLAWLMFHGEHNLTVASSPEEALSMIKNNPTSFDACVVDYHFSNSSMDGIVLASEIIKEIPNAVILISSSAELFDTRFKVINKSDYDIRKFII